METNQAAVVAVSDGLLTVADAMRFASVSESTIYRLMNDGRLPFVMIDSSRRVPRRSLIDLLAKNFRQSKTPGAGNVQNNPQEQFASLAVEG